MIANVVVFVILGILMLIGGFFNIMALHDDYGDLAKVLENGIISYKAIVIIVELIGHLTGGILLIIFGAILTFRPYWTIRYLEVWYKKHLLEEEKKKQKKAENGSINKKYG
jgi:hypothetical protein